MLEKSSAKSFLGSTGKFTPLEKKFMAGRGKKTGRSRPVVSNRPVAMERFGGKAEAGEGLLENGGNFFVAGENTSGKGSDIGRGNHRIGDLTVMEDCSPSRGSPDNIEAVTSTGLLIEYPFTPLGETKGERRRLPTIKPQNRRRLTCSNAFEESFVSGHIESTGVEAATQQSPG